ncbi:MAG: type II toxin-antitoxin system PemK/MazF family toxin [Flavobacteriales bacterium]|nr:type II toxin-antitoxin system PemK/MazF family toxin [Flavobacteriales bacterium]
MLQGEIRQANLNPTKGSEQSGFRPVVVISGNLLNQYLEIVICCPLTSKIKNYKGNIVLEPTKANNLEKTSEILTFHIRSISKGRLVKKIGKISDTELKQIRICLNEILTY